MATGPWPEESTFRDLVTQLATRTSIHLKDGEGGSPLVQFLRHPFSGSKTVSVLRIFLDTGAHLSDRDSAGKSCLVTLIEAESRLDLAPREYSQIAELFLGILDEPPMPDLLEEGDITPRLLVWAVQRSQETLVVRLLDYIDDVYTPIPGEGNKSLLEISITSKSSISIFEELLSKVSRETLAKPFPDSRRTLVHACCENETPTDVEYLKAILEAGADVDATYQPELRTGLILASIAGSIAHIQTLLQYGANMTKVDSDGWCALRHAANQKDAGVLKAFGDFDIQQLSPATFSTSSGHESPNSALIHFVTDDTKITEYILNKFPFIDVNCQDDLKQTPLHLAAVQGDVESARLLVSRGASLSTQSSEEKTALHLSCIYERSDMVDFLISEGAKLDLADVDGWTLLHHAAHRGYQTIARQLLDRGAKHLPDKTERTPELLALVGGHTETSSVIRESRRVEIGT